MRKNRLVTSPSTSGDYERSKPAKPEVVYLSRSPEVNKFGTVWKCVYDFLLVGIRMFCSLW